MGSSPAGRANLRVRGGRAGPTFHTAGGRGGGTIDTKRRILVEIQGLPLAVRVGPAS